MIRVEFNLGRKSLKITEHSTLYAFRYKSVTIFPLIQ